MNRPLSAIALCVTFSTAQAAFTPVDDFESYTTGNLGAGATFSDAFAPNGGPWFGYDGSAAIPASSFIGITDGSGNQYLRTSLAGSVRGAYRSVTAIPDGDTATYFFRVNSADATPDVSYGLSDVAAPAGGNWSNYEVQLALLTGTNGFKLVGRSGGTLIDLVDGLSVNTWYDIWVEVNNATDTYNVFFATSGGPETSATKVGANLAFRNGTTASLTTFIVLPNSGSSNNSARLDDLNYHAGPIPESVAFTYVDATGANTVRRDGQPFSPAAQGNTSIDNNWETRLFGNSSDVYEAGADGAEDAPMLVTTLSGLTPNTTYVLHGYFWDASTGNWRFKASADPARIHDNGTPSNLADDFLPTNPLTHFASDNNAVGTATEAALASTVTFVTDPLFTESDRRLMLAALGTATSDANGEITVHIDDLAGVGQDQRTWYDGLGYRRATPLVSSADEDGDGLTNGDEQTHGTDPYLADSDGDGFSDGAEVAADSDPLDPQSVPPLPGNSLQLTADGAWTWFNDERAIFHQGSLFTGYVKANGQYGVTRYDPATHESFDMVVSTATSQQQDDHNNPSITVLPDGKLMILYAKHRANSNFYQRTSLVPLPSSISDWGPEIIHPLTTAFGNYDNTYNNTYLLSGESDRIYNFHRYINFNPTITVSNDLGATWEPSVPFIAVGSGAVRPYPRYCSNGNDRIDLIYTDGHPRDVDNSVYHMFYQNGTFRQTDGTAIDTFANLPLDHEGGQRGSVIYQYSAAAWGPGQGADDWIPNARGWTWDVHYGADGNPVCVFQVQTGTDATWSTSRIYYYYARWTGTAWQKRFIAQGGRGIYAAESDYGGGMCVDPKNPNVIYISTNAANPFDLSSVSSVPLGTNARYEIYRGVTSDGGLTFNWTAVTNNSVADNLRPIIPEDSPYDHTLLWFNGTYTSYTNFGTRVLAILRNDFKIRTYSFNPSSNTGTLEWTSSPGWRYRITGSADLNGFPHTAVQGIDSQGSTTTHTFGFPAPLQNQPRAFFRVESE